MVNFTLCLVHHNKKSSSWMKVQNVTNKNKTLEENMDYFKV